MVVGVLSGCGGDSDSPTGPQGQTLEVNTEEWDNGNIKVEFQYYRDGGSVTKHGFYKEYDDDGTLRVDGTYFEDKEKYNGKWVEYYESGEVEWEANYTDGNRDGKWVEYHTNGQILYEGNYKDGKKEGKWVRYYESGEVWWEGNYMMGKKRVMGLSITRVVRCMKN